MSKSSLFLISAFSACLGGSVVALAIWIMANASGIFETSKLDPYGPGKGYEILAEYQCKFGETKKIITRGIDDDFALGNSEPEQRNERLFHLPGISANYPARRAFDEGGQDKGISGYFDVPSNISKGIFVTRVKPGLPTSKNFGNDMIQIGQLQDYSPDNFTGEHHAFHAMINRLQLQPGWIKHGDIYSAPFKHIKYRSAGAVKTQELERNYHTLLEQLQASSPASRIDFSVIDDTRVDFAGIAYCEYPETKKGLTFINSPAFDAAMPDLVVLACTLDPKSKWCNPIYGDTDCDTLLPLACFLDENTSVPDLDAVPLTPKTWVERYWGGGTIAFSPPVQGTTFKTLTEVNNLCVSTFGEKWRILDWHDSNLQGVAGRLHGERYQGRAWVDIKDQANATCWAREAAP